MTIELYSPETDDNETEYSFWGEFPGIAEAIAEVEAEAKGDGEWMTGDPDGGRYTGKITVTAGVARYESL